MFSIPKLAEIAKMPTVRGDHITLHFAGLYQLSLHSFLEDVSCVRHSARCPGRHEQADALPAH